MCARRSAQRERQPKEAGVRVTRIGVLSAGKLYGLLAGFFGLLFGVFVALFSVVGAGFAAQNGDGAEGALGFLMGVGAVVFLPILYGVIGFVSGVLTAWIYNLLAGAVGGLEIELSQ
jgi:hypothetical protein